MPLVYVLACGQDSSVCSNDVTYAEEVSLRPFAFQLEELEDMSTVTTAHQTDSRQLSAAFFFFFF